MIRKALIIPLLLIATIVKSSPKDDFELVRDTEILINMMRALQQHYVDTLSSNELLRDASYGISSSLDPYTTYIDEEDMKDFEIMTTGKYGGIGSIIRQKGDWVSIVEPYKNSPADKGGLKIGDKIVSIDGKSAKGMTVEEVSSQLKGTPGSRITIEVCSVIDSAIRKVTLRRERISIPAISYYDMLNDSVAYLIHSDFTDGCYEEMRSALNDLSSRGMKSLVLDYRSNGGGIMQEAIKVLSLFLPKNSEVLTIKERDGSISYRTEGEPPFRDLPLTVLINGSSASAAEIVAGALQDMDRAVLIGQKSFGKGLVQSTVPVGYNSYIKITTARYHIPSGRCIQAIDYSPNRTSRDQPFKKVADSLRKEFYTKAGRLVKDGGGITPDIDMKARYVSRFAMTLYAMDLVGEWGDEYYRNHYKEPFDAATFTITPEDYASFSELALSREINYESQTSRMIKQLEEAANDDRREEFMEHLTALKEKMKDDPQSNLELYKKEITSLLNQDVVLRRAYSQGVVRNSLPSDQEVMRAVEILLDRDEYNRILSATAEEQTEE